MKVRILVYSGRPDPVLVLDGTSDRQLIERVSRLVASAPPAEEFAERTVIPSILGYKGLLLSNPASEGGLPRELAVYRGVIEVRDGGEARFLLDEQRQLESLLLEVAVERGVIEERLLEAEQIGAAGTADTESDGEEPR